MRESPALNIANSIALLHAGDVIAVEPNIDEIPLKFKGAMLLSFEQASEVANIHVMLVDHKKFKDAKPNLGLIIDTKGIWT